MAGIISVVIGYLLGSLSTSILLSKFMKFPDPREQGSGNAGATNMLRNFGKDKAMMTLAGDAAKGLIAIIIGRIIGADGFMLGLTLLAVVAGHVFPVYFGFKGGKGVATALGGLLGINIAVGFICILAWAGTAYFTRYASLASLLAVIVSVILIPIFSQGVYFVPVLLTAGLIVWKHWDNIERLKSGTESKIEL